MDVGDVLEGDADRADLPASGHTLGNNRLHQVDTEMMYISSAVDVDSAAKHRSMNTGHHYNTLFAQPNTTPHSFS